MHPSDEDLAVLAEVNILGSPQGERGYTVTEQRLARIRRHVFGMFGFGGCRTCQEMLSATEKFLESSL